MFTGIIECQGLIKKFQAKNGGFSFWIKSAISARLKVDQSVSHDGVCLTVEQVKGDRHRVTAIEETLAKSNISEWKEGYRVNLERSLKLTSRVDGHLVQGHVDTRGTCVSIIEKEGSKELTIQIPNRFAALVIEKGSIAINGISLTAFNVSNNSFDVAIIPYTLDQTNIGGIGAGDHVNIEFDMIGKYINRKLSLRHQTD